MQQPGGQTWNGGHRFQMGGRAPLPPRWRRPCESCVLSALLYFSKPGPPTAVLNIAWMHSTFVVCVLPQMSRGTIVHTTPLWWSSWASLAFPPCYKRSVSAGQVMCRSKKMTACLTIPCTLAVGIRSASRPTPRFKDGIKTRHDKHRYLTRRIADRSIQTR